MMRLLLVFAFAAQQLCAAEWTYLDNGKVRLGVREDRGASISYFSLSGSDRNLLNDYDTGRCVQQSYYGAADGSRWDKQPWKWNPVQGGHYKGEPAKVTAFVAEPQSLYSKTTPKHWATGADLPEVAMEQWITLEENTAKVRFKMSYSGTVAHPKTHQEIPAIFVDAAFRNLVFYKGDAPWTNAALTRVVPGWPNELQQLDEHWAAYVNEKDWGVGFFNRATREATTYRYTPAGAPQAALCSYIAPLATFAVTPGLVFTYDIHLVIGTVEEIRTLAFCLNSRGATRADQNP